MPRVTYDTNVFIRYNPRYFPTSFWMCAVVIQELAAGANDAPALRGLDQVRRKYEREERLLVPTGEDWWYAGKVLNALCRGARSHRTGRRVTAISRSEQQRILRDVLIARTARRANAAVVTENLRDFEKIRSFCNVRVLTPAEFF